MENIEGIMIWGSVWALIGLLVYLIFFYEKKEDHPVLTEEQREKIYLMISERQKFTDCEKCFKIIFKENPVWEFGIHLNNPKFYCKKCRPKYDWIDMTVPPTYYKMQPDKFQVDKNGKRIRQGRSKT